MVHPPTVSSITACMQWAFAPMLRWLVAAPIDTFLELLHILANQPPVHFLVAKQPTCYAHKIEEDLAYTVDE